MICLRICFIRINTYKRLTYVFIRVIIGVKGGVYVRVNEIKQLLKQNDCYLHREGSRHEIWISRKTGKKFQVPRHGAKEVPMGTLKSILQSAGIE